MCMMFLQFKYMLDGFTPYDTLSRGSSVATLMAMPTQFFFRLPKALNGLMTKHLPCIHNTVFLLIKHPCIVGPV